MVVDWNPTGGVAACQCNKAVPYGDTQPTFQIVDFLVIAPYHATQPTKFPRLLYRRKPKNS